MPSNPTPAEGVVVPRDLLDSAAYYLECEGFETTAKELRACLSAAARPAAPTQSAGQMGEVERLRAALERINEHLCAVEPHKALTAVQWARNEAQTALSQPEQKA